MVQPFRRRVSKLLPLWAQIVIAFAFITAIVTFVSGIIVRQLEESSLRERLEQQAHKTVALITAGAIDAVISEDIPLLETIVQGVANSDRDIAGLSIENEDGILLVSWQSNQEQTRKETMEFDRAVVVEGERFGRVTVRFDIVPFRARIESNVNKIRGMLAFFLLLLSLLILLSMQIMIVRPLRAMNRRLAERNNGAGSHDMSGQYHSVEFERLNDLITTRLQMEAALRKERDRNMQIIKETPALVYGISEDDVITFVNPAFESCTGFKGQELIGRKWHEVDDWGKGQSGDDGERGRFLTVGHQRDFQEEIRTNDGCKCTVLWHHLLKKETEDAAAESIGFGIDISGRQQAEEKLRKAKEEWERTFDSISEFVTILDAEARITRINRAACELLGAGADELIGKTCCQVFQRDFQHCMPCPVKQTAKDHAPHYAEITLPFLGKIFQVSTSPLFDDQGGFVGIVHIAKDVTEQKKLEAQIFQSHKLEAIGTLAGGIAHDFNNILAAILGYTDLALLQTDDAAMVKENLLEVRKASIRAKNLIAQILAFSRQGAAERQPVQVSIVIKEIIKLLQATLPSTIEIRPNIQSVHGKILSDPTQVHQILMNLCTNAAHSMQGRGGVITVSLEDVKIGTESADQGLTLPPGPYLKLSVSDTGSGMDRKLVDRIFDPFFTTKAQDQGTGLGLSVVHGLVKDHGGAITVRSEVGRGTTFELFFPEISVAPDTTEENIVTAPPTGSESVLLVDDEEELVAMGERILRYLGYQVTARTSSIEALQIFKAQPDKFDLVVSDQTMPAMTGFELARQILAIRPDTPIILCTGFSETVTEQVAKTAGIREFVMKPLVIEDLAVTLRKVLDKS